MQSIRSNIVGACMVVAGFLLSPPVAAQDSVPHLESCTGDFWGFLAELDYEFGTVNGCQEDVSISFMRKDGRILEDTVKPRDFFETDLNMKEFDVTDWIAATCPAGYVPKPGLSMKDWQKIMDSKYQCVKK